MSKPQTAGMSGLVAITVAVLLVSIVITLVTGAHGHWVPVAGGLGIGWLAVASVNER